jgi:hypothetical protein
MLTQLRAARTVEKKCIERVYEANKQNECKLDRKEKQKNRNRNESDSKEEVRCEVSSSQLWGGAPKWWKLAEPRATRLKSGKRQE